METTTSENPENNSPAAPADMPAQSPKKNTFLMVICILTFVGSGFGLLGGMFSLATANAVSTINNSYQEQMDNQNTPGFLKSIFQSAAENSDPAKIREMALARMISNLLTLFGAIMMLKLRKPGFYLYVAGIAIYILAPLILMSGFLIIAGSIFNALIGIGFVIMYGVNLKYMNKGAA